MNITSLKELERVIPNFTVPMNKPNAFRKKLQSTPDGNLLLTM